MTLWRIRHGFDTTVEAATEEQAHDLAEQAYEQYVADEPEPLVVEPFRLSTFDLGPEAMRQHFEPSQGDSEDPTVGLSDEDLAEAADDVVGNPGDFFWEVFDDLCGRVLEKAEEAKAEREKKEAHEGTDPRPITSSD